MAAESLDIDEWIVALLSGDTALAALVGARIYPDAAPQGAAYPFVLYQMVPQPDEWELGGGRATVNPIYRVVGVGQTRSFLSLLGIADRIDALLHGAQGSHGAVTILSCLRTQEVRRTDDLNGQRYRQLGGEYQIQARSY